MKKGDEKFNKKDYIKSLDIYKDVYFNSQSGPALKGILNSMLKLNMNEEAL